MHHLITSVKDREVKTDLQKYNLFFGCPTRRAGFWFPNQGS